MNGDMTFSDAAPDNGPEDEFLRKIESLDSSELINASGRLIDLTNSLNLEDCSKAYPFLMVFPFVDDFERLREQTIEVRKIYGGYSLDNPFDVCLFRKMQVLAHQLAPRANAYVAYSELKSQLCLDENDFFDEVCTRVDARIRSSESNIAPFMKAVQQIKNIYKIYLF